MKRAQLCVVLMMLIVICSQVKGQHARSPTHSATEEPEDETHTGTTLTTTRLPSPPPLTVRPPTTHPPFTRPPLTRPPATTTRSLSTRPPPTTIRPPSTTPPRITRPPPTTTGLQETMASTLTTTNSQSSPSSLQALRSQLTNIKASFKPVPTTVSVTATITWSFPANLQSMIEGFEITCSSSLSPQEDTHYTQTFSSERSTRVVRMIPGRMYRCCVDVLPDNEAETNDVDESNCISVNTPGVEGQSQLYYNALVGMGVVFIVILVAMVIGWVITCVVVYKRRPKSASLYLSTTEEQGTQLNNTVRSLNTEAPPDNILRLSLPRPPISSFGHAYEHIDPPYDFINQGSRVGCQVSNTTSSPRCEPIEQGGDTVNPEYHVLEEKVTPLSPHHKYNVLEMIGKIEEGGSKELAEDKSGDHLYQVLENTDDGQLNHELKASQTLVDKQEITEDPQESGGQEIGDPFDYEVPSISK